MRFAWIRVGNALKRYLRADLTITADLIFTEAGTALLTETGENIDAENQ